MHLPPHLTAQTDQAVAEADKHLDHVLATIPPGLTRETRLIHIFSALRATDRDKLNCLAAAALSRLHEQA